MFIVVISVFIILILFLTLGSIFVFSLQGDPEDEHQTEEIFPPKRSLKNIDLVVDGKFNKALSFEYIRKNKNRSDR